MFTDLLIVLGRGHKGKKASIIKIFFQSLGEEGFYMFLTIFEGADSKFNCYQSCIPAVFSQFKE